MIKRLLVFAVVVVVVLLGFFSWLFVSLSAVNLLDTTTKNFTVEKGDGIREISKKLRDQGLIRDQVAFFLLVKRLGIEKNIQAGVFSLSPSLTSHEIASELTLGTEDIWITIPEGWRSEEILEYLFQQGINTKGVSWKNDEGRLFPETYRIPKSSTAENIHDLLRRTFDLKTSGITVSQQTLVLASLVEREAKFAFDRPMVASVLLNRIELGMKLDIDATIQYVLGKNGNWWPKDLTFDDLKVKSPYNTYINAGIPPAPICNPGLSAILAIINPEKSDNLYYVSDKTGNLHFAKTLAEHGANVAKYLQY